MATIKDVARLAGVSVATVSRVLNHSPKASAHSITVVNAAMAQLNYIPNANARALAQQSTATLGLLVNDVSDPFFGAMVKAVDQVAIQTGNFLLIGNGYHRAAQEKLAIEQLIRHQCQSLVIHAKMISDDDLRTMMEQVPGMVLNNRLLSGFESRCIALDNRYGSWLATRHLIAQGHQHIAYVCSSHSISDAKERLGGYQDALRDHGLMPHDECIAYGEPDENGGEQATISLLAQGKHFTAIACYNDSMAAGVLAALTDNNLKVPEQVSVIGFDDVHVSRYVRPRLTTVRYPVVAMAQQAARLALALGHGLPLPPVTHLFQPTLVIRHSVARLEEL
ncbi:HTH-type transcriptional regulator GalR [Rosenbergiella australiborealis]|uniref:HTH-type transcriptional regulator GalR n=1 Tax=Rosenbergiella australiborealis TaxID=1544696 RepID=A0ABS5T7I6_9GAMM|nr:HTH-type transcriptional regulator GalR [Rosenbergiella australiborealis]MBT0728334.1 HTH-type transcriptional regulator GalR [Rosenbergiella australiborealis]